MTDELLSVAEAASRLRISVATVYRLIADGALEKQHVAVPGTRARRTRIPATSVDTYLHSTSAL